MSTSPLLGQIVLYPYNFAPRGWAFCNGQILSIAQHTALFSILGTTYGGNGQTTFALPDLRGRVAVHAGQGPGLSPYDLGQQSGSEQATLIGTDLPQHSHAAVGTNNAANNPNPVGQGWAADGAGIATQYAAAANAQMNPRAIGMTGGGGPHNNIMPVLTLNFCIALQGIFPSRN
jgi:microcystin-dependent protein